MISRSNLSRLWELFFFAAGCISPGPQPALAQEVQHPENYITIIEGALPIVITAPHGGTRQLPDVPARSGAEGEKFKTVTDSNTDQLAQLMGHEIEKKLGSKPFLVIANFSRKAIDLNRGPRDAYEFEKAKPYYDAYHSAIERACRTVGRKWNYAILLDIHGQKQDAAKIFRGTGNGKTVVALIQKFGNDAVSGQKSLAGLLTSNGLSVSPASDSTDKENPAFNGGYTVRHYGGEERIMSGMSAIQLEFGGSFRTRTALQKTAQAAAEAICKFAKTYLLSSERPGD